MTRPQARRRFVIPGGVLGVLALVGCASAPSRPSPPAPQAAVGAPTTSTPPPAPVVGERWRYVGTAPGGDPVVYVDAHAIGRTGGTRTAWRRDQHPDGSYHVSAEAVDCTRRRTRTAKVTAHRADGTVLRTEQFDEPESPFLEPSRGSVGETFMNLVCGRG